MAFASCCLPTNGHCRWRKASRGIDKGGQFVGVHEKRASAGTLKGKVEFEVFEIDESLYAIYDSRCFRKTDKGGIVHIDIAVSVNIFVPDVSRHDIAALFGRIGDFRFILEQPFGDITDLLGNLFSFLSLPCRFFGRFFNGLVHDFVVSQCPVQYDPQIFIESVLDFA